MPYEYYTRDALNLLGMPANSASEFRSKYGNPTKAQMATKAKAALAVMGIDGGLCRPETKI